MEQPELEELGTPPKESGPRSISFPDVHFPPSPHPPGCQVFFGSIKQKCYCGAAKCGGFLGVKPKAESPVKKKTPEKKKKKRKKKQKEAGEIQKEEDEHRLGRYVRCIFRESHKAVVRAREGAGGGGREGGMCAGVGVDERPFEDPGNPPFLRRNVAVATAFRVNWLSAVVTLHHHRSSLPLPPHFACVLRLRAPCKQKPK